MKSLSNSFKTYHPLYGRWYGIITRCKDSVSHNRFYYLDKGITVCDEWLIFENFRDWFYSQSNDLSLEIDRIDSSKGYNPDNCRLLTSFENKSRVVKDTTNLSNSGIRYMTRLGDLISAFRSSKNCCVCNENKDLIYFELNKSAADGRSARCKRCGSGRFVLKRNCHRSLMLINKYNL